MIRAIQAVARRQLLPQTSRGEIRLAKFNLTLGIFKTTILVLIFGVCAGASAQTPQYTITDLGPFIARRLNNSAQVVGATPSGTQKAILFRDGVMTELLPPNATTSSGWGINNLGDVVGETLFCTFVNGNCTQSFSRGFIFRNNTYTVLPTLGGTQSIARSINDSRQVTGYSRVAGQPPATDGEDHAFLFHNGNMQNLGPSLNDRNSIGTSINASGQIVGLASTNTDQRGAFILSNGNATFFEQQGISNDVNDAGHVVGQFQIGSDEGKARAFLFTGGVRQDLGTLMPGHGNSGASGINNLGVIVGLSSPTWFSSSGQRAFIYRDGVMQDLNNLIPANSGWELNVAADINDAGQIVGNATRNGESRAFLLTPMQPTLMVDAGTSQALAFESVSFLPGPFRRTTPHNLSADNQTRIVFVTRNVEIIAGENIPAPTVVAEDANHQTFNLPVEFVGKVPGDSWLTQIVVKLPIGISNGDLEISISYRGFTSNRGRITVIP